MILGDKCTRRCRFCSVHSAQPEPPQSDEPQRLADAVRRLQLKHVVITSVTRDDLPDEGAGHFAACIQAVREQLPSATIEILPPDFHARRDCIQAVCEARPDVFNHNLETVERITPEVRPQAGYRRSLETLRLIRELAPEMPTKSGLMVGLGETMDEIRQTLADLRAVDCNIVTVGQYLSPTSEHYPVQYFWTPEEFQLIADYAHELGFAGVASGPFVRSSYNAGEVYEQLRQQNSTT
jgi:lipoic acid synthetase